MKKDTLDMSGSSLFFNFPFSAFLELLAAGELFVDYFTQRFSAKPAVIFGLRLRIMISPSRLPSIKALASCFASILVGSSLAFLCLPVRSFFLLRAPRPKNPEGIRGCHLQY
jgi:hypothetical protein